MHLFYRLFLSLLLTLMLALEGLCEASAGIIKEGDRWVFLGDSITAQNTYIDTLKLVAKHYHPEATLTFINSGQGGDRASSDPAKLAKRVLDHNPTVVSVMYGMNEAINNYSAGKPKEKELATYREALTTIANTLKERGITPLFMAPTLTDPSAHSFFNLDKSVPFLREAAEIMQEVAAAHGAIYIPVQQEFEAFQKTLPIGSSLVPDGVHPGALGHYQIARSLWEHTGLTGPLQKGDRKLAPRPAPAPVVANLASPFVQPDATSIEVILRTSEPLAVTAHWSLGDHRQSEPLNLVAGENRWTIAIPEGALPSRNGQSDKLLFNLKSDAADHLYILDLCRTALLHFKDNQITGSIDSEKDRPEGRRMVDWKVERVNNQLLLSFEVFDDKIHPGGIWPFSRDGLNLMIDYRPTERFGQIGIDNEVTQLFLDVMEEPFFAVGVRAWTGLGIDFAVTASATKTETGYTVKAFINRPFKLHTSSSLAKRDFIGLLVAVADTDGPGSSLNITSDQKNDGAVNDYANNLPIIDLKNKLPGDAIINASLFPPADILRP